MNKCDCYISNKYQLIANESVNHFTLDELMRLVNRLKVNRSFVYSVSNLAELNEIFKYYPTKAQTVEILGGATGIVPVAQNLTDDSIDYAWLDYYTKEEVIAFINAGFIPELPAKTYVFTVNPTPATATVILNGEVRNSIVVYEGEEVIWQVEDSGFTTQIGILNVTENTTIDVVLNETETGGGSEDPVPVYTVCIEPTPSDANVYINGVKQNCITKGAGAVVTYDVLKSGYIPQSGTININSDKTVSVVLEVQPEKPIEYYTLTINPTPTDALVVLNGVEQNTITVEKGTVVEWSVSKLGYFSRSGSQRITENTTLDIELIEDTTYIPNYSFCINATPADAVVKINGFTQSCIEAQEDDIITWSVAKEGYITESGTYTVTGNYILNIDLEEYVPQSYTLTINPTPADAVVKINGEIANTITVVDGTSVSYSVEKEGYIPQSETLIINKDIVLNVSLRELGMYIFTVNPYPNYAIVKIDDEIRNTITVKEGTIVTWVVSLTGYTTQAGTYKVDKDSSINVFIECMGEPQIITTLEELKNAGVDTGHVIDLCMYDLSQYNGALTDGSNSFFEPSLISFEGDIFSTKSIYDNVFKNLKELREIKYLGELRDNLYQPSFMNMCENCTSLVDVSGFNTNIQYDADLIFNGCTSLTHAPNTELWYNIKYMSRTFANCSSLTDISGLKNIGFKEPDINDPYVYSNGLFMNCSSLTDLSPIADWDVTNFYSFSESFDGCTSLSDLTPLSKWRFPNADEMGELFAGCTSLTSLNGLEDWTFVSKEDGQNFYYSGMFSGCENLVDVSAIFNWNIVIESGSDMFRGCSNIRKLDLSKWDFSSGGNIGGMFRDCYNLNEVKFGGEFGSHNLSYYSGGVGDIYPFHNINTTGILYYPAEFADSYTELIGHIPSTWTAVAY